MQPYCLQISQCIISILYLLCVSVEQYPHIVYLFGWQWSCTAGRIASSQLQGPWLLSLWRFCAWFASRWTGYYIALGLCAWCPDWCPIQSVFLSRTQCSRERLQIYCKPVKEKVFTEENLLLVILYYKWCWIMTPKPFVNFVCFRVG